jgi:hypothetical protein
VDKTVTETENGYRVRYEFKKALILPDDVYSACDVWKFDGFFTSGAPSMPMYPYASDSFTIPTGCVASIQVVDEEWLLEESAPAPGRLPLCVSDTIGYSKSNVSPVRTDLVGWYPTNSVIDNGTHSYKGIDIVNIGISPVQFDCVEGTAKVCKTLEYEISFSKALSSSTETSSMAKNKISENGLVKEDRIWKYYSDGFCNINSKNDSDPDNEELERMYLNLKFSGITNIDDKDYYNCYVWKDDQDFNESTAILIAYMREDNGKVYARYIPDAINLASDNDIELSPTSPVMDTMFDDIKVVSQYDVLVYDNSLSVGDCFYTLPEDSEYSHKMEVCKLTDEECLGRQYKVWTIKRTDLYNRYMYYYENIGDIYGLIPFPSPIPYYYSFNQWDLEKVVDLDGNVIFETSKITSGVKNLTDDRIVTTKYYTLDGKAVTKPYQPGIYIKSTISASGVVTTEKAIVK